MNHSLPFIHLVLWRSFIWLLPLHDKAIFKTGCKGLDKFKMVLKLDCIGSPRIICPQESIAIHLQFTKIITSGRDKICVSRVLLLSIISVFIYSIVRQFTAITFAMGWTFNNQIDRLTLFPGWFVCVNSHSSFIIWPEKWKKKIIHDL